MKKEELVAKLEVAKEVTSVVSIDLMLAALGMLEETKPTGITQELADEIANRIERCLDHNSNDLVNKDDVTFNINYGNTIEVDDVYIDVYETMEHITACLEEFIVEEGMEEIIQDEDVIEVSNETGHTLPGFENGVGLDNLNIRFQDKQGI
jgi:hypothetical protein